MCSNVVVSFGDNLGSSLSGGTRIVLVYMQSPHHIERATTLSDKDHSWQYSLYLNYNRWGK